MASLKAMGAQLGGLALLLLALRLGWAPAAPLAQALLQGSVAALLAAWWRSDRWWWVLHLAFAPALVLAQRAHWPAWSWLLPLCLLLLIYGASFRSQVPLFLSNRRTVRRFSDWLPAGTPWRVLDAGSGTGTFVAELARLRPECRLVGLEQAVLPAVCARWRTRAQSNVSVRRGDLWQASFADCDVLYAFLSPVPMPALWVKCCREMRAGAWLVSNSFQVPGQTPDFVLQVSDRRATRLYGYRIPAPAGPA